MEPLQLDLDDFMMSCPVAREQLDSKIHDLTSLSFVLAIPS